MILGVDTSLGTAVAVLDRDGVVRAEAASDNPLGHAEVIGDLLVQVLADAAARASDIDLVATGMGPGPFTGLRVGIAAARAFALGIGADVVSVPSHDAAALGILMDRAIRDEADAPFAVVTDARRREFAYSTFGALDADGIPVRLDGPLLTPRDDVDDRIAGYARIDATAVPAAMIGLLAARMRDAGREAASGEPLYLRAPDVTLGGQRKRVTP